MNDAKAGVFSLLSAAIGKERVFFSTPETEARLPCVSFLELNNLPEPGDDGEYLSAVEIAVDVWGESSVEVAQMAQAADEALCAAGWTRAYATDIPPDEAHTVHKNMRYTNSI